MSMYAKGWLNDLIADTSIDAGSEQVIVVLERESIDSLFFM